MRSRSINSDTTEDGEEQSPDNIFSNIVVKLHSENQETAITERKVTGNSSVPAPNRGVKEAEWGQSREKEEQGDIDRLFIHLRDNMEMIREFCKDTMQQIPIPEQCVIEGNVYMTWSFVSVSLAALWRMNADTEGGFVSPAKPDLQSSSSYDLYSFLTDNLTCLIVYFLNCVV